MEKPIAKASQNGNYPRLSNMQKNLTDSLLLLRSPGIQLLAFYSFLHRQFYNICLGREYALITGAIA